MRDIVIRIPGEPPTSTHQMKQVNFRTRRFYEPEKVRAVRAMYEAELLPYAPPARLTGPVAVYVVFAYEAKKGQSGYSYKVTKPDLDNTAKLLLDCMSRVGFWHDDAQVAALSLAKVFERTPYIEIRVASLEDSKIA